MTGCEEQNAVKKVEKRCSTFSLSSYSGFSRRAVKPYGDKETSQLSRSGLPARRSRLKFGWQSDLLLPPQFTGPLRRYAAQLEDPGCRARLRSTT